VFRARLQEGVQPFSPKTYDAQRWEEFAALLP
jgi:hypothetical protein